MKARCVEVANKVLGRESTEKEQRDIESRMSDAMKSLALRDPEGWLKTPLKEKMNLSAKYAAEDLLSEVKKKRERLEYTIQQTDYINNHAEQQIAAGNDSYKLESLARHIIENSDQKSNTRSIEENSTGIFEESMRQMVQALNEVSPKFLGLFQDKNSELLLRRALHGEDVGNPEIMRGAKAIIDSFETLRLRANAAGGDIGFLEDRGHAHSWSMEKFADLGADKVKEILRDRVDPKKYVHDDGRYYSEKEREGLLDKFFLTVTTDGANKGIKQGSSIKANAYSDHRAIHFKDGTAATEALQLLSNKNIWQSIIGEAENMSKHIAILEKFGANPDHSVSNLLDQFHNESILSGMDKKSADALKYSIATWYNHQAGYGQLPIYRPWLASAAQGMRNLMLLRLGFVPISSIGDIATMFHTAMFGSVSSKKALTGFLKGMNPLDQKERRMAMNLGLMIKTLTQDAQRYSADDTGRGWTGVLGNAFMRATQVVRFNDLTRRSFKISMMNTIGDLTRRIESVKDLEGADAAILKGHGIDQKTWDIWRKAEINMFDGDHTILDPQAIYNIEGIDRVEASKAASALMAIVASEGNMAVVEPGVKTRSILDKYQRGTWDGELVRSALMFKTFTHAFLDRHLNRAWNGSDTTAGKAARLSSLVAMTWAAGIFANWIRDLLNTKNPRNINPLKGDNGTANLLQGLLSGGGLGPYGEFLVNQLTEKGNTPAEMATGPSISVASRIDQLLRGRLINAFKGKDDINFKAKAIKTTRELFLPIDLWYTKAIFDHMIFNNLLESVSPGFIRRAKHKAEEQGASYYVDPVTHKLKPINIKHAIGDQ